MSKKNYSSSPLQNKTVKSGTHYPSSVREWDNSIYTFNKNSLNLITPTSLFAMNIIKSYFNLFNKKLERKMRAKRLLLRLRRLSLNRIFVSNGEFKHTNNKVLINLYIYNRQKHNYLNKIKNIYLKKMFNKKNINNIVNKLKFINEKGLDKLKQVNYTDLHLIKTLNIVNKNYKLTSLKSLQEYTLYFYNKIMKISMKRIRMYFLYKQLIFINKNKLNYTYLHLLKKYLEKLYNKNVEFNVINLKRFYLNSDILFESIKLKLTRNRKKLLRTMNKLKNKIKVHKKPLMLSKKDKILNLELKNINNELTNNVISNLKYRHVTGFRLEAKGRLTKRHTASRALSKLKYKGNLLNIDSSYRGLSSVMLKGSLKSNVQFTKLNSKTRIGSFGIKGWVSGN